MGYKLSPSSISLMEECPCCFWLTQHKKWKRPSGIFPSLPSGMDGILKTHFDKFRDKGLLPPEIKEHEHTKGLLLFNEPELMKVWRSNFKGIRWEDKDGNIISGAIDNLLVKGKKLIVFDYKTRGYALKDDTADHYQNQMDIYNFLLRKNGYDTEDYAFLLFYMPKHVMETGEVIFDTQLVKRKINVENADKIITKALALLNKDKPKQCCGWCEGR